VADSGLRYLPTDFAHYQDTEEASTQKLARQVQECIPEGQRNTTLTSLAGSMHRRGMPEEAILAALYATNTAKCSPPLPRAEVEAIATSISRYPAEKQVEKEELVRDAAHAATLEQLFRNRYRWVWRLGKWLAWDATCWVEVSEDAVADTASQELRRAYAGQLAQCEEKKEVQRLTQLVLETQTRARLEGGLKFLRARKGIQTQVADLDADGWLLNVRNGTLDLRTWTLRSHTPSDLITKRAEVIYDPSVGEGVWARHLQRFLPNENVRRQVQRDLGTAIVGVQLEEALPIWYGLGGNGKTTTTRAIMETLGNYAQRAAPSLLLERKHQEHPTQIADLRGARWVVSVEPGAGARLAEALVKEITGGERLKARHMRQDYFEFQPTHSAVYPGPEHARQGQKKGAPPKRCALQTGP